MKIFGLALLFAFALAMSAHAMPHDFLDRTQAACRQNARAKSDVLYALDHCLRVPRAWYVRQIDSQLTDRFRFGSFEQMRAQFARDEYVLMPCAGRVRNFGWERRGSALAPIEVDRACRPGEMMLAYAPRGTSPIPILSADCLNPQIVVPPPSPPLAWVRPIVSSTIWISKAGFPGIMFHPDSETTMHREAFGPGGSHTFTGAIPELD